MNAQLVLQPDALDAVARAGIAVRVEQVFGTQEQRNAPRTLRRVGQPRQHEVNDIASGVMLAPGDEDLLAGDAIGAVAGGVGACRQGRQVGARLRFGQVHRSRPFAGNQARQEQVLLRLAAMGMDSFDGALAQRRQQGKGHVGAVEHVEACLFQRLGQALAAIGRIGVQSVPAAFGIGPGGVGETRRQNDVVPIQSGSVEIADAIERRQHVAGQLPGRLQHGVADIAVEIGKGGRSIQRRLVDDMIQAEGDIFDGRAVGHLGLAKIAGTIRRNAVNRKFILRERQLRGNITPCRGFLPRNLNLPPAGRHSCKLR